MAKESCGTCRVWLKFTVQPNPENKGICRLSPPTTLIVGSKDGRAVYDSAHPVTKIGWWCGQWQVKLKVVQ